VKAELSRPELEEEGETPRAAGHVKR
jgi:hypothetical protein